VKITPLAALSSRTEQATAMERVIFEFARPRHIVITTPNREYNVLFPTLPPGKMRHNDHRFEWTRAEFAAWAEPVAARFGYEVQFAPVGGVDPIIRGTFADGRLRAADGGHAVRTIESPELALVVLIGASGSGKSTFGRRRLSVLVAPRKFMLCWTTFRRTRPETFSGSLPRFEIKEISYGICNAPRRQRRIQEEVAKALQGFAEEEPKKAMQARARKYPVPLPRAAPKQARLGMFPKHLRALCCSYNLRQIRTSPVDIRSQE
jgi:hypothetical protein